VPKLSPINRVFFYRIHHADLANRRKDAECEGLWSASSSSSSSSDYRDDNDAVFWGLTGSYGGNYGGPEGFCFDVLCGSDETIEGSSEDDMRDKMRSFADEVARQAGETKGRNVMLTMGMDFWFSDAGRNYANLDLLIEAADRHFREDEGAIGVFDGRFDGVNIFYSTPDRYTRCKYADAVHAASAAVATTGKRDAVSTSDVNYSPPTTTAAKYDPATWRTNVKTGDFFPYADCEHCYWSGYFSSRQGLKRQERVASSFLQAARQIECMMRLQSLRSRTSDDDGDGGRRKFLRIEGTLDLSGDGTSSWNASPLFALEDASGIAQHHDAVAGTSKQRKSALYFDTPILLNQYRH